MVHIGRPGEDGFTERVLASWGVDGHNSHTNVRSIGGRTGFHFWMGIDRPSPDHANAAVIYLISAHLESGHYFNPHAQRITQARANGAKVIVLGHPAVQHRHARRLLAGPAAGQRGRHQPGDRQSPDPVEGLRPGVVRRWWNWAEYLTACHPEAPVTFEAFEFAAAGSGVSAETLAEVADVVAGAGHRFSCHSWRSAAAGNLGGWQVSRTLFLISAARRSRDTRGHVPERLEQVRRGPSTCRRTLACGRS